MLSHEAATGSGWRSSGRPFPVATLRTSSSRAPSTNHVTGWPAPASSSPPSRPSGRSSVASSVAASADRIPSTPRPGVPTRGQTQATRTVGALPVPAATTNVRAVPAVRRRPDGSATRISRVSGCTPKPPVRPSWGAGTSIRTSAASPGASWGVTSTSEATGTTPTSGGPAALAKVASSPRATRGLVPTRSRAPTSSRVELEAFTTRPAITSVPSGSRLVGVSVVTVIRTSDVSAVLRGNPEAASGEASVSSPTTPTRPRTAVARRNPRAGALLTRSR